MTSILVSGSQCVKTVIVVVFCMATDKQWWLSFVTVTVTWQCVVNWFKRTRHGK